MRRLLYSDGNPQSLPVTLWRETGPARRSTALTPLYVVHFEGVRAMSCMTAHKHWEFIVVLGGRGVLDTGESTALGQGSVCLIPPDLPHREEAARGMSLLWIGLRGDRLRELDGAGVHHVCEPSLCAPFEQLWTRSERWFGLMGPELDGLLQAAFGRFLQVVMETPPPGADRIDEVVHLLHREYAQAWTVGAMARRAGCSGGYFHRVFRQRTGSSPLGYLTAIRMQHALHWLTTSHLRLEQIAPRVGYRDPLYFSRAFRKHFGVPPTVLRQQS